MNDKLTEIKTILSNEISVTKLQNLFKTDYSVAFEKYQSKNLRIYRGDNFLKIKSFNLTKPRERRSIGINNIYTTLFSEILPNWKNYPKRNHSIICSLSYSTANNFSENIFCIFPKNGSKIAICPTIDMWDSFENNMEPILGISSLEDFANNFDDFKSLLNYEEIIDEKISLLKFFNYLKNISISTIDKETLENIQELGFYPLLKYKNDLITFFDKLFDPSKNKFRLENLENLSIKGENELWFDNEYIAIYKPLFEKNINNIIK